MSITLAIQQTSHALGVNYLLKIRRMLSFFNAIVCVIIVFALFQVNNRSETDQ